MTKTACLWLGLYLHQKSDSSPAHLHHHGDLHSKRSIKEIAFNSLGATQYFVKVISTVIFTGHIHDNHKSACQPLHHSRHPSMLNSSSPCSSLSMPSASFRSLTGKSSHSSTCQQQLVPLQNVEMISSSFLLRSQAFTSFKIRKQTFEAIAYYFSRYRYFFTNLRYQYIATLKWQGCEVEPC